MLSKENQTEVVNRDREIRGKIIDLQNQIAMLEMLDSFDPIEATGIEADRRASNRKFKEEVNG